MSDAERDDMLARAVRRERVEMYLDVLAFEQRPGAPNRKGVRIREGAMKAFARSGRGAPFMRDHLQGDSTAKGGEIVDAQAFADEDGRSSVRMTVQLMDPDAVQRALRGLMKSVSVGLSGGMVYCTACDAEVLTECYHLPLDIAEGKDGQKMTVEWEWQNPELIETSEVPIPAVAGAKVRREVRAALGWEKPIDEDGVDDCPQIDLASGREVGSMGAADPGLQPPPKVTTMDPKTPADPAAALAQAKAAEDSAARDAELAIAQAEAERQLMELAKYRETARQADEDKFILGAKVTGRIVPIDEDMWRDLYKKNAERAEELMARRPIGCSAPVGTGAQAVQAPRRKKSPALQVVGNRWVSERQRKAVLKSGMTDDQYHAALAKYDEMHEGVVEEVN